MKELGITKGEWQYEIYASYYAIQNTSGYTSNDLLLANSVGSFEAEHNADLICDAGNTAQKCGLLPSELLRQRDELREALIDMVWQFAYEGTKNGKGVMYTGGLSALEGAFSALGLSDPITVEDFEAAIKSTEG